MLLMPFQFNSSAKQQNYLNDIRNKFVYHFVGPDLQRTSKCDKESGGRWNYLGKPLGHDDIVTLDERRKKVK